MGKVIPFFKRPAATTESKRLEPGQISLPFLSRPKLYAVLATHIDGAAEFERLCRELRVARVFDLRVAPRLDLFAPTRAEAFQLFEASGVQYRDVLGRIGATSYSVDFNAVLEEVLSVPSHSADSGLMMFESPAFRELCVDHLDSWLEIECLSASEVSFYASERLRM